MSAAGVVDRTSPRQGEGPGANPRAALHDIVVRPVPMKVAREMVERYHYLHTLPGGTCLAYGAFVGARLLGAVTLGVGPFNACALVNGAGHEDAMTLTRLWLDDSLPGNSETRVLGVVLRALRKYTSIRFLVSYADPARGHLGVVYQAGGWLYTGKSDPVPLYDFGDGVGRRTRTVGCAYGTRSLSHFARHGIRVTLVHQEPKHRYVYFLDPSWRPRLRIPVLPYPKKETQHEGD